MSETVIETRGLRKEFRTRRGRHVVAVHDLDLAVPTGGVHGFLKPNGSGKTTTIRMLLGLARASKGEMRLFGQPVPRRLPHVMGRVGAVVEQPKFVPTFSGRRNLTLLARSIGLSRTSVDAAIEQVGLRDIRDMIRELGRGGVTVLLSSHILAEVSSPTRAGSPPAPRPRRASAPQSSVACCSPASAHSAPTRSRCCCGTRSGRSPCSSPTRSAAPR